MAVVKKVKEFKDKVVEAFLGVFASDKNLMSLPLFATDNKNLKIPAEQVVKSAHKYVFNNIIYQVVAEFRVRKLGMMDRTVTAQLEYFFHYFFKNVKPILREMINSDIAILNANYITANGADFRKKNKGKEMEIEDIPKNIQQVHLIQALKHVSEAPEATIVYSKFRRYSRKMFKSDPRRMKSVLKAMAGTTLQMESTLFLGQEAVRTDDFKLINFIEFTNEKGVQDWHINFNFLHFHNLLEKGHSYLDMQIFNSLKIHPTAQRLYEFLKLRLYGIHSNGKPYLNIPYSQLVAYLQLHEHTAVSKKKEQIEPAFKKLVESGVIFKYEFDESDMFDLIIVVQNNAHFINDQIEQMDTDKKKELIERCELIVESKENLHIFIEFITKRFVKTVYPNGTSTLKDFTTNLQAAVKKKKMLAKSRKEEKVSDKDAMKMTIEAIGEMAKVEEASQLDRLHTNYYMYVVNDNYMVVDEPPID